MVAQKLFCFPVDLTALSKMKVVFLQESVHQTMLAGGRVHVCLNLTEEVRTSELPAQVRRPLMGVWRPASEV